MEKKALEATIIVTGMFKGGGGRVDIGMPSLSHYGAQIEIRRILDQTDINQHPK